MRSGEAAPASEASRVLGGAAAGIIVGSYSGAPAPYEIEDDWLILQSGRNGDPAKKIVDSVSDRGIVDEKRAAHRGRGLQY